MDRYQVRTHGSLPTWQVIDTAPAVFDQDIICDCSTEHEAMVVWRAMTVYDVLVQEQPDVIENILESTDDAKARDADEKDMAQIAREWDAFDRE